MDVSTVGIVGILAYIRQVIFHKSNAARLGWETDRSAEELQADARLD
jgi:hypothetical protein